MILVRHHPRHPRVVSLYNSQLLSNALQVFKLSPPPSTTTMVQFQHLIVFTVLFCDLGSALLNNFHSTAQIKRKADEIENYYDYIIIGGGTSGLLVADRLTENKKSTYTFRHYRWN